MRHQQATQPLGVIIPLGGKVRLAQFHQQCVLVASSCSYHPSLRLKANNIIVINTECGFQSPMRLTYHLSLCLKANNIVVNKIECRLCPLPWLAYHLSLRLKANNTVNNV